MPETSSWPLPPHVQLPDFLPSNECEALLRWVLANEGKFDLAKIIDDASDGEGLIDSRIRVGSTTRILGALRPMLEWRMRDALPSLETAIGTKTGCTSIELELAAHGDGAHYKAHLDVSYGPGRKRVGARTGEDRVLSAVYYFYREPKSFSGGALRIYRFSAEPSGGSVHPSDFVDIEPLQNSLVAFPSWALHEVRPVRCLSERFEDSRFALNCWFCRKL